MLQNLIESWSGEAYRHLPDGNYDVYDFSYTGLAANNRWNIQGEQTLYLAGDVDVAAGEWSRHFQFNRSRQLAAKTKRRKVYQMTVNLDHTLNLCDRHCWQELSLKDAPNCFLDKNITAKIITFIINNCAVIKLLKFAIIWAFKITANTIQMVWGLF